MNSKGQVLVIFIILLPILLMIMSLIIDLGLLYIEKRNISNNLKDAIVYYLDNIDKQDVKDNTILLLNKNIDNIKIKIDENDEYIIINIRKDRKGINNILKLNNEINITYKGNKINKDIIKG